MSALHWIAECNSALNPCVFRGPSELRLDNPQTACLVMSSCIPCSDLKKNSEKNIRSRHSIEIVSSQILQNTEKPTPAPCLSMPPQPATSCGLPLIPLWLLSSLSASDRMRTAISCWVTGGALATLSNSLWDWQPSAPKGIRNTTGKQFES